MDPNGPALAPPPGVVPNFDNPPNNNPLAIGVITACAAVSTLCLVLRGYTRVFLLKKVQIEEGMFFKQDQRLFHITDLDLLALTLCAYVS